jgi:hypothetical protein
MQCGEDEKKKGEKTRCLLFFRLLRGKYKREIEYSFLAYDVADIKREMKKD